MPIVEVSAADKVRRSQIVQLLKEGGEVDVTLAEAGLTRARRVVAVFEDDQMVAVGAIKTPTLAYVTSLMRKSGTDLAGFDRELGYVATAASHQGRGFGRRITVALVSHEGQLFASTNDQNEPMQRILAATGFLRTGKSWPSSQNPGTTLSLWIRKGR